MMNNIFQDPIVESIMIVYLNNIFNLYPDTGGTL